jgi:surface protein
MNSDIVYEILRYLYICPEENRGALLAKKIVLSQKKFSDLDQTIKKLDIPIVFEVLGIHTSIHINEEVIIYWGDSVISQCLNKARHMYTNSAKYVIKVFAESSLLKIRVPKNVIDVHSIGRLVDLSYIFDHRDMTIISGKKWDTTNVINTEGMFYNCTELRNLVCKNWNTSNIENMSSMFSGCYLLNQNIGKYWDTSSVIDMTGMFRDCHCLDKNIGKKWNVKNVINMSNMFLRCIRLNRSIGINWDTSSLKEIEGMFLRCFSLSQPVGKNWNMTGILNMANAFFACTNYMKKWNEHWIFSEKIYSANIFYGCIED